MLRPITTLAPLLLGFASPAIAQTPSVQDSANSFCATVVSRANTEGVSAAPGSPLSLYIMRDNNLTYERYSTMWRIAKAIGSFDCARMW